MTLPLKTAIITIQKMKGENPMLDKSIDELIESDSLSKDEILSLLNSDGEELYKYADRVREENVGDGVHFSHQDFIGFAFKVGLAFLQFIGLAVVFNGLEGEAYLNVFVIADRLGDFAKEFSDIVLCEQCA